MNFSCLIPIFFFFFIPSNFPKTNGVQWKGWKTSGLLFCTMAGSWRPRIRKEQWERLTVLIPATGWFFIPPRCVLKSNKACKQPAESIGPNWSAQKALITRTLTRKTSRNFSIFPPRDYFLRSFPSYLPFSLFFRGIFIFWLPLRALFRREYCSLFFPRGICRFRFENRWFYRWEDN